MKLRVYRYSVLAIMANSLSRNLRMRLWLALVLVVGLAETGVAQTAPPAPTMRDAARKFLATLDPAQKSKAMLPFNSEERFHWFYTPVSRKGVPLKELNPSQQQAALALLHAGLSEKGYTKAETIRKLEDVLSELEQGRGPTRDPDLDFFAFFGAPAADGTWAWGWRYEGHHCSQNWTIVNGKSIGSSPQFFGANPAEVREGPMKGTQVLSAEEDLGRALVEFSSPRSAPTPLSALPRLAMTRTSAKRPSGKTGASPIASSAKISKARCSLSSRST